jgi:hypothetical protein
LDEILDRLFRIGDLKVISRTSSMRFKNSDLSLKEIAGELGVSAVLEGSVQRSGDDIRISVQLIDAKTDTQQMKDFTNPGFIKVLKEGYAEAGFAGANKRLGDAWVERPKATTSSPWGSPVFMPQAGISITRSCSWKRRTRNMTLICPKSRRGRCMTK